MRLIKIYAPWCGGCKIITPVLESISKEYSIEIEEIDADAAGRTPEGIEQLDKLPPVRNLPTVFVMNDNNEVVETLIGRKSKEEYLIALKLK